MRPIYLTAFCGLLVVLLGVLMVSSREFEEPGPFRSTKDGQSLSIRALSGDEMVVVVYRRYRWEGTRESLYQISGGPIAQFLARSAIPNEDGEVVVSVVRDRLTDAERVGMDSYLLFLRHAPHGSIHREDDVIIGYYRGGVKIGEERFRDGSGVLHEISIEDGILHGPAEDGGRPESFPSSVYREIIHPVAIERRLKEANQPRETTAD